MDCLSRAVRAHRGRDGRSSPHVQVGALGIRKGCLASAACSGVRTPSLGAIAEDVVEQVNRWRATARANQLRLGQPQGES